MRIHNKNSLSLVRGEGRGEGEIIFSHTLCPAPSFVGLALNRGTRTANRAGRASSYLPLLSLETTVFGSLSAAGAWGREIFDGFPVVFRRRATQHTFCVCEEPRLEKRQERREKAPAPKAAELSLNTCPSCAIFSLFKEGLCRRTRRSPR